jgi:hypothetical protein
MAIPTPEKSPQKASELVDDVIKTLEQRLQAIQGKFTRALQGLKSIRGVGDLATLETVNKLVDEITQGLNFGEIDTDEDDHSNNGPAYTGTLIERVRHFFAHTRNHPATNATIRKAIGTSRGSLAMVLYSTHADEFERTTPSGTHLIHWELTAEALNAAYKEYGGNPAPPGDDGDEYAAGASGEGGDAIPF